MRDRGGAWSRAPNPSVMSEAELAEAVMTEAQRLEIDVTTLTVAECVNAFLEAER
jgi:hypothetical protein